MGRKAKEEAQQKMANWTKSRRNVSKTSTKENANTSNNNENRAPLQTKSQSAINSMKNESVSTTPTKLNIKTTSNKNSVLSRSQSQCEKIPLKNLSIRLECLDSTTIEELVLSPPKSFAAVEKIFKKDKKNNIENVYDYTFDNDAIPLVTEDAMKDVYEKLAKENKIEVKKYRAKNVKRQPEKKGAAKREKTQKRRRDRQPAEIEPPRKKPNLKNKKVNNLNIAPSAKTMKTRSSIKSTEKNNNLKNAADAEKRAIGKKNGNDLLNEKQSKNVSLNERSGEAFARLRLRNRIQPSSQSTPKTSTPLNVKTVHFSNFDVESPVLISETRKKARELTKQRLELSIAEERIEANRASPLQKNDSVQYFDDDDFPMPSVCSNQDKENTLTVQGSNTASSNSNKPKESNDNSRIFSPAVRRVYGRSPMKNIVSSFCFPFRFASILIHLKFQTSEVNNVSFDSVRPNQQNRDSFGLLVEGHSAQSSLNSNMSRDSTKTHSTTRNKNLTDENDPQPSTSKGFSGSRPNQCLLACNISTNSTRTQSTTCDHKRSIENESQPSTSKDFNDGSTIFSPTKHRVYGRSPLTSDENNSHATLASSQSNSSNVDIGSMPTLNSIHISRSMIVSADPKKTSQLTLPEESLLSGRRQSPVEIYFEGSEAINVDNCFGFDDNDEILAKECAIGNVSEKPKGIEKPIAPTVGLKNIRETLKRFLHSKDSKATAAKQSKSSNNTSPSIAKQQKKVKSPMKQNLETIFAIPNAKRQKDIRSALTAQANEKEKSSDPNENISAPLFEEVEMVNVQHGRKSYSGPVRQYRKRYVSIDSEPEKISDDDDEDFVGKGEKPKAKRRKKAVDSGPKVKNFLQD